MSANRLMVFAFLLLFLSEEALPFDDIVIRTAAQSATEPKFIEQFGRDALTLVGLCVDIHRAMEHVVPGIHIAGDQKALPAIRVEAELVSGDLDAGCGFSKTKEREEKLVFIDPPLFVVRYYLVARADDEITVSDWEDIRRLGKSGVILTTHGFGAVTRLQKIGGLHIDSGAANTVRNLQQLTAKRGRFYYHRAPGLTESIRSAGVEGKVRVLPIVMDTQPFYLVASKTLPADAIAKLGHAVAVLDATGELTRMFEKWNDQ